MFSRILIANRGEIAVRVIRTLRTMGIESVAVYSDADAGARHVAEADLAVRIGPSPARQSYLDIGPTADYSVDAMPATDNFLDFEDLIMIAINFEGVTLTGRDPGLTDQPGARPRLELRSEPTPDGVLVKLLLSENPGTVKGLHAVIDFDHGAMSLVTVEQGALLAGQGAPIFFRHLDETRLLF